jgi:hypothetical protein
MKLVRIDLALCGRLKEASAKKSVLWFFETTIYLFLFHLLVIVILSRRQSLSGLDEASGMRFGAFGY